MKLVADESVDFPIVVALRADGHDVVAVVELAPGINDEKVLELANQRKALLLTGDKDFGVSAAARPLGRRADSPCRTRAA